MMPYLCCQVPVVGIPMFTDKHRKNNNISFFIVFPWLLYNKSPSFCSSLTLSINCRIFLSYLLLFNHVTRNGLNATMLPISYSVSPAACQPEVHQVFDLTNRFATTTTTTLTMTTVFQPQIKLWFPQLCCQCKWLLLTGNCIHSLDGP
jgi:hypothetical protein